MSLDKTRFKKDFSFVFVSNLLGSGFYFLITIIATRSLSVEKFGIFSIFVAISWLLPFFLDLGLNITNLKFLSENKEENKQIIGTMLWTRIITGIVLFVFSLFFGKQLIEVFFKVDASYFTVQIMVLSCILLSIVSLLQTILQANLEFFKFSLVTVLINASRFVIIIIALLLGKIGLESMLLLYFSAILIPFLIVLAFTIKHLNFSFDYQQLCKIVSFSKWVAFSSIVTAIIMRVDTIMLGAMSTKIEVAKYAVAFQIAFIIPLITNSLSTALFPRMISIKSVEELQKFKTWLFKIIPFQVLISVIIILSAKPLIIVLFGKEFIGSSLILNVLLISFMIGFIFQSMVPIFYAVDIPNGLFYVYLSLLVINITLNLLFVPLFGALGAAISAIAMRIAGLVMNWVIINGKLQKERQLELEEHIV